MKILFLAMLVASPALANEYEHYTVRCDVYGTQQTLSSTAQRLPRMAKLTVSFVRVVGNGETLKTRVRWSADKGDQILVVSPREAAMVNVDGGKRKGLRINVGDLDAASAATLLEAMGAKVPELSKAVFTSYYLVIGTHYLPSSGRATEAYPATLEQIHFDSEMNDGLAYHLIADDCEARFVGSQGDDHRMGH